MPRTRAPKNAPRPDSSWLSAFAVGMRRKVAQNRSENWTSWRTDRGWGAAFSATKIDVYARRFPKPSLERQRFSRRSWK